MLATVSCMRTGPERGGREGRERAAVREGVQPDRCWHTPSRHGIDGSGDPVAAEDEGADVPDKGEKEYHLVLRGS